MNLAIQPGYDAFCSRFASGAPQLVWASIAGDLHTPVSAMLRLKQDDSPCFLLESVEKAETRGRYSIIGLKPDVIWQAHDNRAALCYAEQFDEACAIPCPLPALESLRKLYLESQMPIPPELPPMSAGLIGYMGYDMVRQMEHLPSALPDSLAIPTAMFIRPKLMVIFDSVTDKIFIITPIRHRAQSTAEAAWNAACARIQWVFDTLNSPSATQKAPFENAPAPSGEVHLSDFTSNTSRPDYDRMVAQAKEHILAGDIFQVVLSQRFSAPFTLPAFTLYRSLRSLNPSPFLFYLHFGKFTLVGSSPEILVRLRDGEVTIRPIAGTRPRGRDAAEDKLFAKELLSDAKEISEHLMLLDLGRNDVGRVTRPGTVSVNQNMTIENYSHVMHIVSNVIGELDARFDALSALIAGFPAGTVSGAPKVRAMQIIDALEPVKRSFYGGCIGYFSANGNMDTAIALRTGLVKDGMLHVQAGGGIVAESDAEMEFQESVNKAKALMRAAELARNYA